MNRTDKETAAVVRMMFDETITHLRAGSWNGTEGCTVELIGNVRDLHGTVCACCPKRVAS